MSNGTVSAARKRIDALLDPGSFVEIGANVQARNTDFRLSDKCAPSDGVITGYGVIEGDIVFVYSQDREVLNGTIGEMHAKKIVALYKLAMKTGAPVIGLIDCAGFRLEEASDSLNGFGKIYRAMADASGVIPQISGIFGTCGGGMSLITAMSDFIYMEENNGKMFVNAPNTIAGNHVSVCDTSSASFQAEATGLIDGMGTEDEILQEMRELLAILPKNNEDDFSTVECTDDLNRLCPGIDAHIEDPAIYLPQISDNGLFVELKASYGKSMVTALIRLNGATVGVLANRSVFYGEEGNILRSYDGTLSAKGCKKAADFVKFCDSFSIPIVSFTNTKGFAATIEDEAELAKYGGKMAFSFSSCDVPKVNVIIGDAQGSAMLLMNSRSLGADLVFAWPKAKLGLMDATSAAKILYADEPADVIRAKAKEYDELHNSVEAASRRGYIDTVIAPEETRKYVIGALEMLFSKRAYKREKKHGSI